MKKMIFVALAVAFLLLHLTPVLAQDTPKKVFDEMDTDKNGKVTKNEFEKFHMDYATRTREARFDLLDSNKDGKITKDEFLAVQLKEAKRIGDARFRRIDANKDGEITEEELTKRFRLVKQSLEQLKTE